MAVTIVYDPSGDDMTLNTRASRRFKLITGSFDYGATAGGGVSFDIVGINNVHGVLVNPANGYVYVYDSGTLKAFQCRAPVSLTTAGALSQVATGTSMATCTALTFMAWGYE